jgi:hypothetical protein
MLKLYQDKVEHINNVFDGFNEMNESMKNGLKRYIIFKRIFFIQNRNKYSSFFFFFFRLKMHEENLKNISCAKPIKHVWK